MGGKKRVLFYGSFSENKSKQMCKYSIWRIDIEHFEWHESLTRGIDQEIRVD